MMDQPSGERLERAKQLLCDALLREPGARVHWLRSAAADDPALLDYVLALLDAGERPLPGLGALKALAEDYLGGERPARIGRYTILDTLGQGGMGTVYLAEQSEPVQRRVALKLVKLGMDSAAVVARFEQERQALALMEHDGIAKVHDCGNSERGQPFFVMELVNGVPLTRYCEERRPALEDRLRLVQKVCDAVQHAHQKGVVHRDLKPSNVLVIGQDEHARVKVIDFGLAKAMREKAAGASLLTSPGQIIGTLEYMAPEQADAGNIDIDTRADVYSLGVILYELLVGSLPFPSERLRNQGLLELQRTLREVDPPRPSARLDALPPPAAAAVAVARQCGVGALRKALRNDLDWVVLKAMEKDRDRRYESASALSADLQRYLDHEPLAAGPPSTRYRLRKLVVRHRRHVLAAGSIFVTAIAGALVATYYAISATRLAAEKTLLASAEREAKEEAERQEQRADTTATQLAGKVREFDYLSGVVQHERALARERDLYPPWPLRISAMESWLHDVDDLLAKGREIERTVAHLRTRALPRGEHARQHDRRTHPRWGEYEAERGATALLERARAIAGGDAFEVPAVPEHFLVLSSKQLAALALERVSPSREQGFVHGEEALGLALARLAVEKAESAHAVTEAQFTLAWAQFANGQLDAAAQTARRAVDEVQRDDGGAAAERRDDLLQAIAGLPAAIAQGRARLGELDAIVDEQRTFEFELESQQFLHDTLVELGSKLALLASTEKPAVERRLVWARRVAELTRHHPNARCGWDDARRALAAADDVVASSRYRGLAVELRDEDVVGLVPIGMNPVSKLWEVYDLRSAWDGTADPAALPIPQHRTDGSIDVGDGTGIVFVLLPGGTFRMGAQQDDPRAPNYDADAAWYMMPANDVKLAPFWLGKYELTQGQWARLWEGDPELRWPSKYRAGNVLPKLGVEVTEAHPVEQIDWFTADALLRHHGMTLPTEAQWEYGCRAGTDTRWICPREELRRYANLADMMAKRAHAEWQIYEPWEDGHVIAAREDSFLPNAFGLYHVHGNVCEWCLDRFCRYDTPVRPGDGLREASVQTAHMIRGGSMTHMATFARSDMRTPQESTTRSPDLGVRPARALHAAR